jgi:large subunit ribosomal protein L27|mmetsp:Transcript_26708/g.25572  ORF Transcript_26708/g.25572 Transcript_26708/m.25572 type:complete len:165 (+) Transcript_26708:129-623(+)
MNILRSPLVKNCVTSLSSSSVWCQQTRLATKKAGGSSRNGRDSAGKRLGLKKFGGEAVFAGNIIIRQRGEKYKSGLDTKMGRDHTIYAVADGWVEFTLNKLAGVNKIRHRQVVSVTTINPNQTRKEFEPSFDGEVEPLNRFQLFKLRLLAAKPKPIPYIFDPYV